MASALTFGGSSSGTALTAGDLTVNNSGSNGQPFKASWTRQQVLALGASPTGNLKVATLPAGTCVTNVFMVVTDIETISAQLNGSVGRTAAGYVDYIVASSHKSAAIYGNASGERGTNNTGYDIPSTSATTDVYIRFDAGADNLGDTVGSAGYVVIEYFVIP